MHNTFLDKVAKVTYGNGDWIEFTYDGSGALIKRENSNGDYWEYAEKFIFKNGQPYSFAIPEGRAIFEGGQWKPEFEYRDVWNNLRVVFGADGNRLVKKQQSDYDVYGYEFNKDAISATNYFKYQNQERIEDFGLNIDFFKYRSSDPTIGRFWSGVDPLAEQFYYNSTYALQENKFGLGVELEGAELKGFAEGVYESIERNVKALTVDLPQTIKGLAMMSTPVGRAMIGVGLEQTYQQAKADWKTGDLDTRGNIVGNVVGEIGIGIAASKGLANVGKGASIASKAGEVGGVVSSGTSNLWKVGAYSEIRGIEAGLDAHHVGQKAIMKKFVPGYDVNSAPAILVPEVGHTIKGANGIVSRSTTGFGNARQVLARDILELRRVYGSDGIPNSSLQSLIEKNKTLYPNSFKK
jgi:hypothetical protein